MEIAIQLAVRPLDSRTDRLGSEPVRENAMNEPHKAINVPVRVPIPTVLLCVGTA